MSKNNNNNAVDIGELLREGTDYNESIEIEMLGKKYSARLRPCTTNEWNKATRNERKTGKVAGLEIVSKCLLDKEGNTFDVDVIERIIPAGDLDKLFRRIQMISGFELEEQEEKLYDKAIKEVVKDF